MSSVVPLVPLGEITRISKGKKPKSLSLNAIDDTYLPYILIESFGSQYNQFTNDKTCRLVCESDIEIVWDGERAGLVSKGHKGYLGSTLASVSLTHESFDSEFIFYILQEKQKYLRQGAEGTGVPHLSRWVVENLSIYKLPLPEQKKIASILTSVDEVIENTQKQIDKLQDLKKATMSELLTKGIGHTEFKDSELGRIPKSWEVIALAELLELKNGLNTNADAFGSGSPFLSYKDIYKDTELTEMSLSQKVEVSERENNAFSVNYGDVFFTRTSETPEEIGFANVYLGKNVGAVFNGFCIRGRPITNKLSVRLSRFLFRSDYVRVQMRFLCKYTTRAGISGESLNRCLLAVPPIDEQEKYLKTLNSIEKMIEAAGKKLSQTQSIKKSLMQDLLTGKVRVTVN